MEKKKVLISIDPAVHENAKDKGLKISSLCEDALREICSTFEHTTNPSSCDHAWTWPFTVPTGLAKECKKCGKIQKIIMESHEETMKRADKIIKERGYGDLL